MHPGFVFEHEASVPSRDRAGVDPHAGRRIPSDDVFAALEPDLTLWPEKPPSVCPTGLRLPNVAIRLQFGGEGITETVDCPHVLGLPRIVVQRGPQLGHQHAQVRFVDKRRRPESLLELIFRQGSRTCLDEGGEQDIRLRGEMDWDALPQHLAAIGVENIGPEACAHGLLAPILGKNLSGP